MDNIESASPSGTRQVIDVQQLLGLPNSTPNPHLWYKPARCRRSRGDGRRPLRASQPAHAAYFQANAAHVRRLARTLARGAADVRPAHPAHPGRDDRAGRGLPAEAAGVENLTPFSFQADIMNGVDPAPQDVAAQEVAVLRPRVRLFLYNQQVTDSLTRVVPRDARGGHVPVVGVYETMPTGYNYQRGCSPRWRRSRRPSPRRSRRRAVSSTVSRRAPVLAVEGGPCGSRARESSRVGFAIARASSPA